MGRGRFAKGRRSLRDLALQRAELLLGQALRWAKVDMGLATRQAELARRLCLRYRVRLPYHLRSLFCHGCKKLIVPGINARVRLYPYPRSIRTTCLRCGHTYRKLYEGRRC